MTEPEPDAVRPEPPPREPRAGGERKAFLLRLPPDLHEELRAWAEHELRSLNGQIEFLLREAVRRRGRPGAGRSDGE